MDVDPTPASVKIEALKSPDPDDQSGQSVSSQGGEFQEEQPSPFTPRFQAPPDLSGGDDEDWHDDEDSLGGDGHNDGDSFDETGALKRPAEDEGIHRPFKRQKGALSHAYLDVLNEDIEEAAHRASLKEDDNLFSSQVGLIWWTASEKRVLYESIARMGKGNHGQIAARIGSKSVAEVSQYIHLLEQVQENRRYSNFRSAISISELPAAVELSQQCCHALDEAADAISLRQEAREDQREESKWGEVWKITSDLARRLEQSGANDAAGDQQPPFVQLFALSQWLQLSRRVFMNSSIPSNNWKFIDENPPSIWATTFQDFHSLALSMTRRLVQTTIFTSMARIRARLERRPDTRNVILRRDVEVAIESLGLTPNSRDFWNKSARRLRVDVYEDEPPSIDEDGDKSPMAYEEIEKILSWPSDEAPSTDHEDVELSLGLDQRTMEDPDNTIIQSSVEENEEAAVTQEANEVLNFSAADLPETLKMRQLLMNRVAIEREQERYAEAHDQYQSYKAEIELWHLLEKRPPREIPHIDEPGAAPKSTLDVESIYPLGRDWRNRTSYWSKWELDTDHDTEKT